MPSLSGQVIIDKNPGITCVVNKTNIIDSTYRNFQMEVLAGDSNLVTKVQGSFPPVLLNSYVKTQRHLLEKCDGEMLLRPFLCMVPFPDTPFRVQELAVTSTFICPGLPRANPQPQSS